MKPAPPVIRIRLPRNTAAEFTQGNRWFPYETPPSRFFRTSAGPAKPAPSYSLHQLLEKFVVSQRGEVVVRPRVLAQAIRAGERLAEVVERVVRSSEQRFDAGDVVERKRVAGIPVQDPAADLERRRVVLRVVRLEEVAHRLARRDRERPPHRRADGDDERPVLLGDRAPAQLRVADEDGGAVRSIDLLARDREDRMAGEDDVELLVPIRAGAGFVVLADQSRPRRDGPHRVDAERADPEVGAKANVLALAVFLCGRRLADR